MTLRRLIGPDPVMSLDELDALSHKILGMTSGDTASVTVEHIARGTSRVAHNRISGNDDGRQIRLSMSTQFGQRGAWWGSDRIDDASLQTAVAYMERMAKNQTGDPVPVVIPERPRHYLPATVWKQGTVDAFEGARHALIPKLIQPMVDAKLLGSAFVGVVARSTMQLSKNGIHVSGHETDTEITVAGWTPDGLGSGWAGQANRDWTQLDPDHVVQEAIRLTHLDANPVAVEPGRWTVILGPPAMAQFAKAMDYAWDAVATIVYHDTPFADDVTGEPKLEKRVFDERITMQVDPNEVEGGYLPFDGVDPLVPMTFVDKGVLKHLAFNPSFAAECGVTPPNAVPFSMRMGEGPTTIDEMIASCERGLYVNRVTDLNVLQRKTGTMSGVTSGGCYMIERGKITRAVRNLRFLDSPFVFLNNLTSIGKPSRTAFGYTPWAGDWPIPPAIVPPVMVRDFNFVRVADAL